MEELVKKLLSFQVDGGPEDGAFRSRMSSDSPAGPLTTAETLFPLLLFPERARYAPRLMRALRYLVRECINAESVGVRPHPEIADWPTGAVDSTAYALLSLCFGRDFLYECAEASYDKSETTIKDVEKAIDACLRYLSRNANPAGWGFAKGLVNRTYSTSLVLVASSHCTVADFERSGVRQEEVVEKAIDYLCSVQDTSNGWSYSESEKRVNPNITAVALYALGNGLRYLPGQKFTDAIQSGAQYILSAVNFDTLKFTDVNSRVCSVRDEFERVSFDIPEVRAGGRRMFHVEHNYAQPYHMLLPALLWSGVVGFRDSRVGVLTRSIETQYEDLTRKVAADPRLEKSIEVWELGDVLFALFALYSVKEVVPNSELIYSNLALEPAVKRLKLRHGLAVGAKQLVNSHAFLIGVGTVAPILGNVMFSLIGDPLYLLLNLAGALLAYDILRLVERRVDSSTPS
jgi:hypothetical protein